jgi:hypothetical protein
MVAAQGWLIDCTANRVKYATNLAISIQLAAAIGAAQQHPHQYVGDIVNANCMQAAKIVNRNSRGYVPPGVNAFNKSRQEILNTSGLRNSILRHCSVNPGTTAFGLLMDDGNFFKLNETGNFEVISQTTSAVRRLRVVVTGFVDRERLNVQTLSIFKDRLRVPEPGPAAR